jgi:hypothetical protein
MRSFRAVPSTYRSTSISILFDFVERAGWSAGQVFLATLLAGGAAGTVGDVPWKYAFTLAVGAALSSAVLTALQYLARLTALPFWSDLLVRLAKTFLTSLGGAFMAAHPFDIHTFDWATALNIAALAVLTALGKGLLAGSSARESGKRAGGRNPSTLPGTVYLAAVQR